MTLPTSPMGAPRTENYATSILREVTSAAAAARETKPSVSDLYLVAEKARAAGNVGLADKLEAQILAAVAGALVVIFLGALGEQVALWLLPVAAGGFIYIASADLIPELHKTTELKSSLVQFTAMLFGIIAMVTLLALEL